MLGENVLERVGLSNEDKGLIQRIVRALPILCDVCRADLLLFCRASAGQAVVVAQAQPHSVSPLYEANRVGSRIGVAEAPEIWRGLLGRVRFMKVHSIEVRGANIARAICPVRNPAGQVIAVLAIDSYWLAYERHRRRSVAFQDALREFVGMVLRGELVGAEGLTPFGEHDGLMFVGADERVEYMSGIALSLYRRLGFRDSLVGVPVDHLDTVDSELVRQALGRHECVERTDVQYGLTWVRKALPVNSVTAVETPFLVRWLGQAQARHPQAYGVFILIHDATEALEAQRELESKTALIREVHHRVKNNLQVIASLMRMQARRVEAEEARVALEESVNRILSVALVHEYLSQNAQGTINLQEVAHRILGQVQQGLLDPDQRVQLGVRGPSIWLPAERATQCALVINELVQNAIEHGIAPQEGGSVEVALVDEGERVRIEVSDSGNGLPEGFSLDTHAHLGLSIVRSMVERDLRGRLTLESGNGGTRAIVEFDKSHVS